MEVSPQAYEAGKKFTKEYFIKYLKAMDFTSEEAEKIYAKLGAILEPLLAKRWAEGMTKKFAVKEEVIG